MKQLLFVYPEATAFSGQSAATDLAIDVLSSRGWSCNRLSFPSLDRNRAKAPAMLRFGAGTAAACVSLARRGLTGDSVLCLNQGLSLVSFLRMGVPQRLIRFFRPNRPIVSSLHGAVFFDWPNDGRLMEMLRGVAAASDQLTVQGARQKARLVEAGVDPDKIAFLPNTCELDLLSEDIIKAKHQKPLDRRTPVRLTHLSSLIESKGFPVFLEASRQLAAQGIGRPIEIVLCGPITRSPYCQRFANVEAASAWIHEQVAAINTYPSISAQWIPGARGQEKARLLADTHVFVMPSRYPVEAQPLVLLEAFASGCAIITSDQGEIPSTVTPDVGPMLDDIAPEKLAIEMRRLIENDDARTGCALAARDLAAGRFSVQQHASNWEAILAKATQSCLARH